MYSPSILPFFSPLPDECRVSSVTFPATDYNEVLSDHQPGHGVYRWKIPTFPRPSLSSSSRCSAAREIYVFTSLNTVWESVSERILVMLGVLHRLCLTKSSDTNNIIMHIIHLHGKVMTPLVSWMRNSSVLHSCRKGTERFWQSRLYVCDTEDCQLIISRFACCHSKQMALATTIGPKALILQSFVNWHSFM